ncbi:hypothetical protein HPGCJGGD_3438 [Methylobacterium haplocladii]|nr:hypothetical protein HPGCJGGD_3438 [Methylobacterium haplocladii]
MYRIQTSMTLAGNLVPEMTRLLKTLSDVDSKTKSVEKSFGRWVSPLNRAASAAGQLNRELSKSSSAGQKIEREVARISRAMSGLKGGNGLDREMQRWASAIGKPIAEMRVMRRETQGVASAARGVTQSISGWTSRINSAAGAMRRLQSAASNVNLPTPVRGGGGAGGAGTGAGRATRGRGHGRRSHGTHGLVGHEGSALASVIGVSGGVHTLSEVIETGVDMRHIELGMRQTGASPAQIDHAKELSYKGSQQFPNLSPVEIFEHINDLRGILGDIDKAIHEAPELLPEFSALKAKAGNHGAKNAVNEIYTAVKSAETANEITSEGVKKHANSLMRLAFWYGDKLNPSNYFTAQKNGGQMLNLTSDHFRYGAFAALSQEIGQRAGTQFATFAAKGVGGLRMLGSGLTEAYKYNLLQEPTVTWNKKHTLVQPGAQFSDVGLDGKTYDRAKDPDLWLYNNVIPKLKAGGVNTDDKTDLLRTLGKIFTDKNAYGFLFELAQQKSKIEKDFAGYDKTSGDTTAYRRDDPYAALQGTKSQGGAVATALSEPAIPNLVDNLNRLNAALGGVANTLEKHPVAAETAMGATAAVVGGAAAAGIAALAIAAVGTLSLPALAVGAGAAVTIAAVTLPWDKIAGEPARKLADTLSEQRRKSTTPFEFGGPDGFMTGGGENPRRHIGTEGLGLSTENIEAAKQRLASTAAGAVSTLNEAASGAQKAGQAAQGAGGPLNALAGWIGGVAAAARAAIGSASAKPAGGADLGSGASGGGGGGGATPGKSSSLIYKGRSAPIQVASSVHLDGRTVGRSVTHHQVAEANTRNGTGSFDDSTLKTPVGYGGRVLA